MKTAKLIIPLINKNEILAANSITPSSEGITLLAFLLTHRAQISATMSNNKFDIKTIQQLESCKWSAARIAKNNKIKTFIASIVVAKTLQYEAEKPTNTEELTDLSNKKVEELVNSSAKGAKILNDNRINNENLISHRHGMMLQLIGKWQSVSIFQPGKIIYGIPITNIDIETQKNLLLDIHKQIEIEIPKENQNFYENDHKKYQEWINENLFPTNQTWNDGINICNDNLFPLEKGLNIHRPIPEDRNWSKWEMEGEDENPLLKLINKNYEEKIKIEKSLKTKGKKKKK